MFARVDAAAVPVRTVVAVAAAAALAFLVQRYDAPPVLGALTLLAAAVPLLLWPHAATLLVSFLIYANVPAVAHQLHGVPQVLAGSVLLLLGFPLARALLLRRQRPRRDPVFRLMLGFLGVLLLSSLFAHDKGIAAARILTFATEGLVLYWLVVNTVRDMPELRRVLAAVLAAGSLLGALSVYQAATGAYGRTFLGMAQRSVYVDYVPAEGEEGAEIPHVRVSDRAAGPIGEPNRYAQILIVLLPLAVASLRHARSRPGQAASAAAGLLILGGIILTYSRGAVLALVLLVAAAAALRWVRPAHLAVAFGLFLAALLTPGVAPGLQERLGSIATVTDLVWDRPSVEPDGAIRGRATEMLAAAYAFADHPILGVGPGQYMPVHSVRYQQAVPTKFRDLRRPRRAHSLYFELAAETGVLGLGLFLAIVGVILARLRRLRRRWARRSPERSDLATAFMLAVGAYLVTGLFLHLSFERYFWFLLALAASTIHCLGYHERAAT